MKKSKILMVVSSLTLVGCAASLASCKTETPVVEATKYTVSFAAFLNGNVSADKEKAEIGETVTVTAALNSGVNKVITGIKVNEMVVGANASGKFVFTMPGADVNVSVVTEDVVPDATFAVTLPEESADLKVEANKVAGLKVGEKVVLTLSLKNNDKFVSGVVAGDAGVALDADGKYSFIMPAQNITVSVTLKDVATAEKFALTLPAATEDIEITSDKAEYVAGEEVVLNVNVKNAKKMISSLKANEIDLPAQSGEVKFAMPSKAATISVVLDDDPAKIEYSLTNKFSTSFLSSFDFSVKNENSEVITTAVAGQSITLWFANKQAADGDQLIEAARIKYNEDGTYNYKYLTSEKKIYNSTTKVYDYSISLVMPSYNVSFSGYSSTKTYGITTSFNGLAGNIDGAEDKYEPGDTVSLYPQVNTGFVITKFEVSASKVGVIETTHTAPSVSYNGTVTKEKYTFKMPAENVTVKITGEQSSVVVSVVNDANISVSNFRVGLESNTGTDSVGFGETDNYAFVAPIGQTLYFNVAAKDGFLPDSVTYSVDGVDEGECSGGVNGAAYHFKVTSGKIVIKTTSKVAEVAFNVTNSEHMKLKFYSYNSSTKAYTELTKLPNSREKIFFKATDVSGDSNGEYKLTSVKNGSTELIYSSWTQGDYYWNYIEPKSEELTFVATESYSKFVFVGKEFVGDYSGSLLNMVEEEDWWGDVSPVVKKEFLRIDNSGLYAYKTSSSSLSSLGTTVLTLADDNKTLTAGTDKFIYQDGWVLKVGDDIASSALMKLGETGKTSALSYAKVDGDAKKAVVKQTIGGTAYYAYVDLTDNTFKVGLTAEVVSGSEFRSDGIITLKDSTNTAYKTFKFSSSSACSSVVSDGIGGTYTAKASTTDYGNLILDGFGSAKFSSFNNSAYTYSVKDVNVGTESEPIMEKQLTLVGCDGFSSSNPSITRVLVLEGTNYTVKGSTKLDASTAISFASGDLAVGAKTYRLTVKFDEKNFYCTSALKAEDGTYGSEVEMLRFASCSFAEDLTGEDTLITLDTEYGFGGSAASSLVIKYHSVVGDAAAYITMNGSIEAYNDSTIAFTLADAILK